jgi:regulator of RNase E activity RraA
MSSDSWSEDKGDALIERYGKLSTPVVFDVLDKMGFPNQTLAAEIRPLDPAKMAVGPAFTILGEPVADGTDYGAAAFEMFRQIIHGSVLVMAGSGHRVAGPWGENASISAQLAGARGMVTDTGTRDASAIVELGFPVFSRYISPVFMSGRFAVVGHQQPIRMDGQVTAHVNVSPGDLVVADRDGVVIVPQQLAVRVLEAAEELERIEQLIRAALRTGEDREAVYKRYPKFAHIRKLNAGY